MRTPFLYNISALACVAAVTTTVSWFTDVSTERHNKEYHVLLSGVWVSVHSRERGLEGLGQLSQETTLDSA